MNAKTRRLVRRRAGDRCEYCRIQQDDDPYLSFHVEHIIAKQHRGSNHPSNLAWSCHKCNRARGRIWRVESKRKLCHYFIPDAKSGRVIFAGWAPGSLAKQKRAKPLYWF